MISTKIALNLARCIYVAYEWEVVDSATGDREDGVIPIGFAAGVDPEKQAREAVGAAATRVAKAAERKRVDAENERQFMRARGIL